MKPFIHKLTIDKPASLIQAGLQKVFDRSLIEILFEGSYSLKGNFTDSQKVKFQIIKIHGQYEPSNSMLGEIVPDGEGRTYILLESNHRRKDTLITDFIQVIKNL